MLFTLGLTLLKPFLSLTTSALILLLLLSVFIRLRLDNVYLYCVFVVTLLSTLSLSSSLSSLSTLLCSVWIVSDSVFVVIVLVVVDSFCAGSLIVMSRAEGLD